MMRAGGMIFAAAVLGAIAAHAQTQARVTIVALGASNTEGWGVSAAEAYPAKLQVLLNARGIDAAVINAGIAGDTTGGMLARLERAVPAGTHLVILHRVFPCCDRLIWSTPRLSGNRSAETRDRPVG